MINMFGKIVICTVLNYYRCILLSLATNIEFPLSSKENKTSAFLDTFLDEFLFLIMNKEKMGKKKRKLANHRVLLKLNPVEWLKHYIK